MRLSTLLGPLLSISVLAAQQPPDNGPRPVDPGWHALTGAILIPEAGRRIDNATIIIRGSKIISVTRSGQAPRGARVWDCSGLTIYPGLIDAHVPVTAPRPEPNQNGSHWNSKVTPQRSALDGAGIDDKVTTKLRELGFTAALLIPEGGIFAGQGAVVLLDSPRSGEQRRVLQQSVVHSISLGSGRGFGARSYPTSQMGAIALIRQTLLDAKWHARKHALNSDRDPLPVQDALDALQIEAPLLFETSDELEALRAAKIAKEFSREAMLVGSGYEYRNLQAVAALGIPIVLPINFPKAPAVETILARERVSLRDLMGWEQAPTNPRRLIASGVTVALTTDKLSDRSSFFTKVRKAIELGLPKHQALKALTGTPAALLGMEDVLGKVAPGYMANLILVDGELFDKDATIRESWIQGRRHLLKPAEHIDLVGSWHTALQLDGIEIDRFEFKSNKKLEIHSGEQKVSARKLTLGRNRLDFLIDASKLGGKGIATVSAVIEGNKLYGTGIATDGTSLTWTGDRSITTTEATAKDDDTKDKPATARNVPETLPIPFGAFGRQAIPAQEDLIIHGATIWTSGPQGIITNGSLVIESGKVSYVGDHEGAPNPAGARTIDATGKHISPGLIDAHSHTGISKGINEGSQAVTSEVRIADVINPDDVGWYRELAGGLTAVNQLHGSSNPIGGQNSVVKLRWGIGSPDAMRIQGAPEGIKFALGENVKRSRSRDSTRYPRTRMGVEAIIRDRFQAASEYRQAWRSYHSKPTSEQNKTLAPQRDLELDALVEILDGERLIHCHSYRQDEILMLCRVAEDFGFKIGTFQHVLEGFKVAEAIKTAAIGASTFSDWWAYKFEANDAIPANGAIMHEVGIPVTFNSDSNELARRLNTEAAKAVKYGGVDPAEALKFVTYNAALQLGVDDRIGSLEAGKDADLVIWSGSPLSTFSRCLETYIDGRRYFSEKEDHEMRAHAKQERAQLIQSILNLDDKDRSSGKDGDNTEGSASNRPGDCGCETEWRAR